MPCLLLVEDHPDFRRLAGLILTRHGFDVRAAADGGEALEILRDFVPDAVLTDLMMPRMDGIELIRWLRAEPRFDAVPIVAMTAACTGQMERDAVQAGAAAILPKPVDAHHLVAAVAGSLWRAAG